MARAANVSQSSSAKQPRAVRRRRAGVAVRPAEETTEAPCRQEALKVRTLKPKGSTVRAGGGGEGSRKKDRRILGLVAKEGLGAKEGAT